MTFEEKVQLFGSVEILMSLLASDLCSARNSRSNHGTRYFVVAVVVAAVIYAVVAVVVVVVTAQNRLFFQLAN